MKKIWKKVLAPLAFVGSIFLVAYTGVNLFTGFPQGTNQVVAHADAVALQANGQIVWATSPGWASTDGTGMTMAEAASYVKGCSSQSGNTLITAAQLQACRVLYAQQTGTITAGHVDDNYYTTTSHLVGGQVVFTCTSHAASTTNEPFNTSSTTQPPTSSTPMTISLTGVSLSVANEGSTAYTVELENPAGTVVQQWTGQTTSTFNATVTSGSGTVGTWTWLIFGTGASGASCDSTNGITGYGNGVQWSGTNFTYYQ